MDCLFERYGNPFLFIDTLIMSGRFTDFVLEFLEIQNEKMMWEFFLHKVYDKSFDEFKESITANKPVPKEQLETTVKDSKSILNSFVPNGGE